MTLTEAKTASGLALVFFKYSISLSHLPIAPYTGNWTRGAME